MALGTASPPAPWIRGGAAPRLVAPALLALAVVLTYANALGNGFAWDDHVIVGQGPADAGLEDVARAVASPDVLLKSQPAPYYRPLTRLWLLLGLRLYGHDPLPYHLENVALHLAAALALLALGRRVLGATAPALAAALLFAVHPVNAEAVNFVSARNNPLVALLTLGACTAYLAARETGSRRRLAAAAVLFLLALASKETALMLLPFLAIHELGRARAPGDGLRERLLRLAPLALVAAAYLAGRVLVLSAVIGTSPDLAGAAAALHVVPKYLWLAIFPAGLTVHHADPETFLAHPAALAAAWAAIAAAVALLVRQRRAGSLFGLLWFAVNVVPVSGVIPIPSAPIAERYLYVPGIGLWLVAADQLAALAGRLRGWRPLAAAGAAVALALAATTARRNPDWKDDLALFSSAARVDPRSTDASYNHAVALDARGDAAGALREWERTLSLDPAHVDALARLGTFHAERGRLEAATRYFTRVLALRPDHVETRFNVALLLERLGRREEALAHYREFVRLDPVDYPELAERVRERIRVLGGDGAR